MSELRKVSMRDVKEVEAGLVKKKVNLFKLTSSTKLLRWLFLLVSSASR